MKKRITLVLLSITSFLFLFLLASCSPYNGNYVEVTEKEQLLSLEEKINDLPDAKANNSNYEVSLSASVIMDYSDYKVKGSLSTSSLYDNSSKIAYSKTNLSSSTSAGSMGSGSLKLNMELWLNNSSSDYSYVNYSMTENYSGKSYTESFKKKGKINDLDIDEYDSMSSMFGEIEKELKPSRIADLFDEDSTKVYVDGNKIKFEFEYNKLKAYLYLIINDDNSYRMKFELPEAKIPSKALDYSMTEEVEIIVKKTDKKVELPKDEDYELVK